MVPVDSATDAYSYDFGFLTADPDRNHETGGVLGSDEVMK
jgi:hypothetical protein